MKNLAKPAVLIASVCLLNSVGLGQQKSIRKTRKPIEPPKIVCTVAAVPKGMVIVGYKDNAGCTSGRELLVKRPDASETVCANSPMPDGYIVQSISGSIECREASLNPLTNAVVITRAGEDLSASSTTNSEPIYGRSTSRREITVSVSRGTVNTFSSKDTNMQHHLTATFLVCVFLLQPIESASPSAVIAYQSRVSIQVSEDDWGEGKRVDIQKVLQSAAGELWRYFPNKRLDSILVVRDQDTPRTRCKKGPNGEHVVQLTAKDRRWAQFAFQFGHEFFHVLSNYEKDCVKNLRIENEWFEEVLAEVSSLFVLKRMSITWRNNPPYANWSSYAAALDEYAQDRINDSQRQSSRRTTFIEWFEDNHESLRDDPYLREKNGLIANRLLPLFERNPESWEAVSYLNMGDADHSNSFQTCLNNWYQHVPRKHERFVQEVARVFGMRITTA